jgi:5-oxoprolinase (ATP-hydrolysing) subunit A
VSLRARTLCVHGDNPHAARIAASVRAALEDAGVELAAF